MVLLAYGEDRDDVLALPQRGLEALVDRFAAKRLSERGLRTVQAVLSGLTAAIYVLLFSMYWYSDFPIMDPAFLVLIGLGLLRVKPAAGRNVLFLTIGGVITGLATFLRNYGALTHIVFWFPIALTYRYARRQLRSLRHGGGPLSLLSGGARLRPRVRWQSVLLLVAAAAKREYRRLALLWFHVFSERPRCGRNLRKCTVLGKVPLGRQAHAAPLVPDGLPGTDWHPRLLWLANRTRERLTRLFLHPAGAAYKLRRSQARRRQSHSCPASESQRGLAFLMLCKPTRMYSESGTPHPFCLRVRPK